MDTSAPVRFNICASDGSNSDDLLEAELPDNDDEAGAGKDGDSEADRMSRSSSLQRILASISVERRSSASSKSSSLQQQPRPPRNKFWSQLLVQHFLEDSGEGPGVLPADEFKDDLVFYVRRRRGDPSGAAGAAAGTTVEVHRKHQHNYRLILADQLVDLEESVYLNLIMQQFAYTVTCAVCTRTGARELQILRRFTSRVFASPSRHSMDGKASQEEIAYPNIFFSVHNYEDLFADCVLRDSELLCVELVACDRRGRLQGVLFLGSIRYESVLEVYQARASGGVGGGSFRAASGRRLVFLRMRGPHGKGHAEVAVTAAPESACGDDVDDDDSRRRRERRLSGGFGSGGGGGGGGGMKKSRSDSANIDTTGCAVSRRPNFVGSGRRRRPASEVDARAIEEEFGDEPEDSTTEVDSASGVGGGSIGASIWQVGRSFGQAWHWFKERRRASSASLNACLTYVSLPWHRIIADLLDTRQQPVLAFDLPAG